MVRAACPGYHQEIFRTEAAVRVLAILLTISAITGLAADAHAREKMRLAQSSVTTTCIMNCNAQYANCQASCLSLGAIPTNPPATTNPNQACLSSCTSQQLSCQISCSRTLSN